jgi:hypothetical protein
MGWVPETLRPEPEPWFVRELKAIDPALRVVFGYQRYFEKRWAIERKMSSEAYYQAYKSLIDSGEPRFVDQPIFDSTKPVFDEYGDIVTYEQIGVNKYDLAPEYEWLMFTDRLDDEVLTTIKRSYAWHERHSFSRQRFEMEQEQKEYREAHKRKLAPLVEEGLDEAYSKLRKKVVFGYGETRREQTTDEALEDI